MGINIKSNKNKCFPEGILRGRLQCIHYSKRSGSGLTKLRDVLLSKFWIISPFSGPSCDGS